jgi:hypothetical protein
MAGRRGAASALCYSAFVSAQETVKLPANASGASALFASPRVDTAMEKIVNVRAASGAIDTGTVGFTLSALLGGWRDRPERATLTLLFLDNGGRATAARRLSWLTSTRKQGQISPA